MEQTRPGAWIEVVMERARGVSHKDQSFIVSHEHSHS
jgi:hypothetical protein